MVLWVAQVAPSHTSSNFPEGSIGNTSLNLQSQPPVPDLALALSRVRVLLAAQREPWQGAETKKLLVCKPARDIQLQSVETRDTSVFRSLLQWNDGHQFVHCIQHF